MMTLSLGERLEAARRSQFVGRTAECVLFRNALSEAELPFNILYLHGPGGVGKTTLLHEFVRIAQEVGHTTIHLDARNLEPSPTMFQGALMTALVTALDISPTPSPQIVFTAIPTPSVLFIDTFELLAPLDSWLRNEFLPQMPATLLTVFSGRRPPSVGWRTDPGWQPFVHVVALRNLPRDESKVYLTKRQIPVHHHAAMLDFTHGHPLALSLFAELHAQDDSGFRPEAAPNVIAALVERFLDHVPTPEHRVALEACAMVRVMNETLLLEMQGEQARTIFAWLRNLSFMEAELGGIFPHDLARETLATDLRWRNPEQYAALHARARAAYMKQFAVANAQEQQAILHEYIFLHRDNPVVRPFFEWQDGDTVFTDQVQDHERIELIQLIQQHEGEESAQLATTWLDHAAQETIVLRNSGGQIEGLLMLVALERTQKADRQTDPAIDAAWRLLEGQTPLRTGERATLFRYWLARNSYQDVSPVQSRIFVTMVQHYLTTPGLAYTLIPCANPAFWADVFAYADLHRLPTADFTVGDRNYGVYGHDWRVVPPLGWLNLLAEREIAMGVAHTMPPVPEALIVLSQSEFTTSVHDALRTFHDANELRNNPLLRSRLVVDHAGGSDDLDARTAALRELFQETAATLQATPRQMKFYRALHHTYFQPASTQELAAELLDVPFSTYRRHLRSGIDYMADTLWAQELQATPRN